MLSGTVFDIREFTTHDGPGIRTTVFLKGCALRCLWCHNPEGFQLEPQLIRSAAGNRRIGKLYTSVELAQVLNRQAEILRRNGGGVTFSGGEPLLQARFLAEVIDALDGLHVVLDTSGYAVEEDFRLVATKCNLVYYDLKLIDPGTHLRYTTVSNDLILRNLSILASLAVPFVIRVPLVPGVTDTQDNLDAIARTVRNLPGLVRVELLPYNRAAGGKYAGLGLEFRPTYDETREPRMDTTPFRRAGVEARVAGVNAS